MCIVILFICLTLHCNYVEFIYSTETSGGPTSSKLEKSGWGDRINWVIPWYSQNLSKIGCCTSGPRYRYDFDLPGVECMIKMPFFPLPCAPYSTRKTWRVCPLPREGTAWALCRFCGVEFHTYVMHLLMINNYFVSNSMSVVVLLH